MKIKETCPNIKYLSMMENPGSSYENFIHNTSQYRTWIIKFLPLLEFLDDATVTRDERINALMLNIDTFGLISSENMKNEELSDTDDEEYITFQSRSYPN